MRIAIIGDSHVRAFKDIENVYPIFIGQGKHINLFGKNLETTINRILEVNNKIENDIIYLSLGEPNCRYELGYKWSPHEHKDVQPFFNNHNIEKYVNNYKTILETVEQKTNKKVFALTASTCYEPSLKAIKYFNHLVLESLKDKCINLTDYYDDLDYYRGDVIHLNTNYFDLFIDKIKNLNHIQSKQKFIKKKHIFENFGCIRPWI